MSFGPRAANVGVLGHRPSELKPHSCHWDRGGAPRSITNSTRLIPGGVQAKPSRARNASRRRRNPDGSVRSHTLRSSVGRRQSTGLRRPWPRRSPDRRPATGTFVESRSDEAGRDVFASDGPGPLVRRRPALVEVTFSTGGDATPEPSSSARPACPAAGRPPTGC